MGVGNRSGMPGRLDRGYDTNNIAFVMALGVGEPDTAVLIFIMYLILDRFPARIYGNPISLWFMAPVILAWLMRVWLLASRGEMDEDPIAFALRDPQSWVFGRGLRHADLSRLVRRAMAGSGERWSWGRAHPAQHQTERPLWREDALEGVHQAQHGRVLVRGLGRSYGDSALNDGGRVIDMTGLDRLVSFDPASGVLECDAGLSLDALLGWLRARGADAEGYWLPAVMPGTQFVTVGGAIANDVHGKKSSFASAPSASMS